MKLLLYLFDLNFIIALFPLFTLRFHFQRKSFVVSNISCRICLFSARSNMSSINNKNVINKYAYLTPISSAVNSTLRSILKAENSGFDKGFPYLMLSLVCISSVKPNFVVTRVLIFSVNR